MTIAIIGAMPEEISTIKNQMEVNDHQIIGGSNFYQGKLKGIDIVLVCCGIGKVHAAVAATITIYSFKPICIINVGTLGAIQAHLTPSTIVLSESVAYHDVDVTMFGQYTHGQVPKMPCDFQAEQILLDFFETLAIKTQGGFYRGLSVTGDQFIANATHLTRIQEKFPQAIGIDMEAAAIAHTAYLFSIPFISIRSVTDKADENSPIDAQHYLITAADKVATLVISAIGDIPALFHHTSLKSHKIEKTVEEKIDQTCEDSFPASDPPSNTPITGVKVKEK